MSWFMARGVVFRGDDAAAWWVGDVWSSSILLQVISKKTFKYVIFDLRAPLASRRARR